MHPFDKAIELTPIDKDRFRGATSPAYANMVGPFGGITHALLLQAAMLHTERLGEPIALTVNFAGPVADGDFEIQARPVRTNRSTQHWSINLVQGETIQAVATAVFAQRREGWSATEATAPSGLPEPGALPKISLERTQTNRLPGRCRIPGVEWLPADSQRTGSDRRDCRFGSGPGD